MLSDSSRRLTISNIADIDCASEALNQAWHAASEDMAKAAQAQGGGGGSTDTGSSGQGGSSSPTAK